MQEAWTARLMQLQDSASEAIYHMLNAQDAVCQSVPNVTTEEHLS